MPHRHRIFQMGSRPWRSLETGGARHGASRCWTGGCSLENCASSPATTGCGPATSACLSRRRRRGLPCQSASFAASSTLSRPSTGALVCALGRDGSVAWRKTVGVSDYLLLPEGSGSCSALVCRIMPASRCSCLMVHAASWLWGSSCWLVLLNLSFVILVS